MEEMYILRNSGYDTFGKPNGIPSGPFVNNKGRLSDNLNSAKLFSTTEEAESYKSNEYFLKRQELYGIVNAEFYSKHLLVVKVKTKSVACRVIK